MSDFDNDLARRRSELQEEKQRAATAGQRADEEHMRLAAALANELTASFKTDRLRFSVLRPEDYEDVEDDPDVDDEHVNPYRVAIWCRDFDDTVAIIVIRTDSYGFLPNWDNDAIEYFPEFSEDYRPEFLARVRKELIDGLAKYLDDQPGG
jgi:hypothetical protein